MNDMATIVGEQGEDLSKLKLTFFNVHKQQQPFRLPSNTPEKIHVKAVIIWIRQTC